MIIGENILIRVVEEEDLPEIHKWSNDFELMEFFDFIINFTSFDQLTKKYNEMESNSDNTNFIIIEKETKKPVGQCQFTEMDFINKKSLCSLYIGDRDSMDKGYGTEAMKLMMKIGFEDLNLNRLGLWVFDFNKKAIKSYKKCGMKVEGIMREGVYRDGKYHDIYFMGILKSEYEEIVKGGSIECSEANM